jgi:hypothetical protein
LGDVPSDGLLEDDDAESPLSKGSEEEGIEAASAGVVVVDVVGLGEDVVVVVAFVAVGVVAGGGGGGGGGNDVVSDVEASCVNGASDCVAAVDV